jgi:serine/threonine protein kinase
MERIKGLSILDIIKSIGRIDSPENIASIVSQAADALAYAHVRGVIHRDLKASNIILVKEGDSDDLVVKILDFGIAKTEGEERITFSGRAVGSPMYMSPEQCSGKTLTPRSDLYSLGVVLYEMACGVAPYNKGSIRDIMMAHCNPEIKPRPIAEVTPHIALVHILDQITFKLLETDPDLRWQSALELRSAIEFWIDAFNDGSQPESLPKEMLESRAGSNSQEDKNYTLSIIERKELHQMTRITSQLDRYRRRDGNNVGTASGEIDQLDKATLRNLDSIQKTSKEVIRLSVLAVILGLTLVLYFVVNFDKLAGLIWPQKPPVVAAPAPAPPAPQVIKPAPAAEKPATQASKLRPKKGQARARSKRRARGD